MNDNREKKQGRVHFTSATEESTPFSAQALDAFQSKLLSTTDDDGSTKSVSRFHAAQIVDDPHKSKDGNSSLSIIDFGDTNHMTGSSKDFLSYIPCLGREKVRIADGSLTPIMGSGTITYTPSLSINSILHVPNFPVNLLSLSSITKSINCGAWFEPELCVFQELKREKILGTRIEHDGLCYLDDASTPLALAATSPSPTYELLLIHSRLGHLPFRILSLMFPLYFTTCYKDKLVCEVCELAKHTHATYPSSNERSQDPFEVVHSDVWGPSIVTSLLGERWFVTFIDGFSRCTWMYVLKQKGFLTSLDSTSLPKD
jgi:hypothetical protein